MDKEIRVVGAALVRGGRVLVARRGEGQAQALLWELPGGKVEAGESDEEALARELSEELGVRVEVGEHLGESVFAYRSKTVRLVAYACTLTEGEPRPREHAELRWAAASDLPGLTWAPADVPLVEAVIRLVT